MKTDAKKLRTLLIAGSGQQSGMTLIEVLVTIVVLALGILGLAPLFALSIEANGRADLVTVATAQAEGTLEDYKQLVTLPATPFSESIIDSTTGVTRTVYVDDSQSDATIPPGMARIRVRVNWTDLRNLEHVFEYTCLRNE